MNTSLTLFLSITFSCSPPELNQHNSNITAQTPAAQLVANQEKRMMFWDGDQMIGVDQVIRFSSIEANAASLYAPSSSSFSLVVVVVQTHRSAPVALTQSIWQWTTISQLSWPTTAAAAATPVVISGLFVLPQRQQSTGCLLTQPTVSWGGQRAK